MALQLMARKQIAEPKPEKKPRPALKEKPVEPKPSNPFGIGADVMLLTDLGRLTKAGFILEFHKLRTPFCIKLFDEIKALLDNKAYMVQERVHLEFLLKSFDRVCLSVWNKRDKLTIDQMKATITRTMRDIQSNIVSNVITILPDL